MTIAVPARAALPSFSNTIEEQMVYADCAFVGRIIRAEKVAPPSTVQLELWWKITTLVDRPLVATSKGSNVVFWCPIDWNSFAPDPPGTRKLFVLLRESRCTKGPRYSKITLALNHPGTCTQIPYELTDAGLKNIPNLGMKPFKSDAELFEDIAPYCVRPSTVLQDEPIDSYGYAPWCSVLIVPVDHRTEAMAQQWIRSKDARLKWNGVRILRHLKSPRNIELLKPVADLSPQDETDEVTRELAINTLKSWGESVTIGPRVQADAGNSLQLAALIASLLTPIALFVFGLQRRGLLSLRPSLICACITFAILSSSTVLWLRSLWMLDGLSVGTWEIGVNHGDLRFTSGIRSEGNVSWPLAYRPVYQLRLLPHDSRRWPIDWRQPNPVSNFIFNDGVDSWLEDTGPYWALTRRYLLPLWLLDVIVATPWAIAFLLKLLESQCEKHRRGFQVVFDTSPSRPKQPR